MTRVLQSGRALGLRTFCLAVSAGLFFGMVLADLPEVVTEQVVAEEVSAAGSADLVRSIEGAEGLPDDPLARALATAILETTRGRVPQAQRAIRRALDQIDEDADRGLLSALLSLWLENGIDRDGRVSLVGAGLDPSALISLARALDLAQRDRCAEAIEILERNRQSESAGVGSLLLEARSWQVCGRPEQALLSLARVGDRAAPSAVDVRVSARVGRILLEQGDPDSAALWCGAAVAGSRALPRIYHQATACLASADAARGVLPLAREQYIQARKAALLDPALAPDKRIHAGRQAVWVALRSRRVSDVSEALELLLRLDALTSERADRLEHRYLRVMALVTLERQIEANAEMRRAGTGSAEPVAEILESMARARLRQGAGDPVGASTDLGEAVKTARREGFNTLLAAGEMDRAHLARWEGRRPLAQRYALAALESWGGVTTSPGAHDYHDPVFVRRAMQFAIEQGRFSSSVSGNRAGQLLSLAERLRAVEERRSLTKKDQPDAAQVRRNLAARNSGLLYYMVGETRSYAWLVEPGGMRMAELPPGEELFRLLFGSASEGESGSYPGEVTEALLGGLLDSYIEGTGLIICPDAFLAGLPWAQARGPARLPLAESYAVSVVSSLGAVVDPGGTRIGGGESGEGLLVVTARRGAILAGTTVVPEASLPFKPLTVLEAGKEDLHEIVREFRMAPAIMHISVPLELAGAGESGIVFSLPSSRPGGMGTSFSLAEIFRRDLSCDLIVLAPQGGWSRAPASRVRAAFRAASGGARAALVPLGPLSAGTAAEFWPHYYGALARGESKVAAVNHAASELPGGMLPAFQVVGHADTLVIEPQREQWPFWAALGGGLSIILIAILRGLWRRRDPFDEEPPEEES